MSKKIKFLLIVSAVVVVILIGFIWRMVLPKAPKIDYRPISVTRGDIEQSISSAGTIVYKAEIEVKSKASGKILQIPVRDGDMVKKGQILLELDKTDEETKLNQAKADVVSAEARLVQAQEKYKDAVRAADQATSLLDAKLATQEDYLKAKTQMLLASADIRIAQADLSNNNETLKNAKISYADTEIRSPINGIVLERLVEEGQIISSGISASSGGTSLFIIGDMSSLISKSDVDEVDIGKLAIGQPVDLQVDAFDNRVFHGKLSHLSPKGINKSNVTVFGIEIQIQDEAQKLLKSGMTDTAKIIVSEKKNVLLVPLYAIQNHGPHKSVFVNEKGRYVSKDIRTGLTNYEQVEIVQGLTEGDTVYFAVSDGASKGGNSTNSRDRNQSRATMGAMRRLGQ